MNSASIKRYGALSIFLLAALLAVFYLLPFVMEDSDNNQDIVLTKENIRELTEARMQSRGIVNSTIPSPFPAPNPADQPNPPEDQIKKNKSPLPIDPAVKGQLADHILQKMQNIKARTAGQPAASLQGIQRGSGRRTANPAYQLAIDDLLARLGSDTEIHVDNVDETLRYLRGDLSKLVTGSQAYQDARQRGDYGAMSLAVLDEMDDVLNINATNQEFAATNIETDSLGATHITMQQQYNGVPVWGAEIGVHFSANNDPVEISGVYAGTPTNIPQQPYVLQSSEAVNLAMAAVNAKGEGLHDPIVEPIIYWDIDRAPRATFRVTLSPAMNQHWLVFVDSRDGSIVHISTELCTQAVSTTGTDLQGNSQPLSVWADSSTFFMIDTSLPIYQTNSKPPSINETKGAVIMLDMRNSSDPTPDLFFVTSKAVSSWDSTAVSVSHNFGLVEKYYRTTFNRNSIDNRNLNIIGIIHPGDPNDVDNAYWHPGPQWMVFGDGAEFFKDLPASLDVAGHELTHGVISHSANLIYENQSGALNEHLADFFGAMIDRDDWQLGEGVMLFDEALRDMKDPQNPNIASRQPKLMSQYRNLPNTDDGDWGGVHINSGIPNHAAYLLAEGADGIGKTDAEQILYRALTVYLRQRSQFIDYRRAAESSARDLFGDNSPQWIAVQSAFDGVGITDGTGGTTDGPTEGSPTTGEDSLIVLQHVTDTYDAFRDDFFYQILRQENGQTRLLVDELAAKAKPAVSGDGQWVLYVDADNNMKWTDGVTVEAVSNAAGMINTVALSKDQRYIAYTTTDLVNEIVILDIENNTTRTAKLNVTRTDGSVSTLSYADFLTFNFRGDFLVYDALFEQQVGGLRNSDNFGVWGVYGMRVTDLVSQQLFAPRPGEQMGNPAIANLSDHNVLVDYLTQGLSTEINLASLDFLNNELNVLDGPLDFASEPSYSGDDNLAVYNIYLSDTFTSQIIAAPLSEDQSSIDSSAVQLLFETQDILAFPVYFRVGEYTAQQGKLSVPEVVTFDDVLVGEEQSQVITLSNIGNGDLELLDYSLSGQNPSSFQHFSFNQTLPSGDSTDITALFVPLQDGPLSAELHILTTDPDQPESIIILQGNGIASSLPTPTPTPTFEPTRIPPTPTAVPNLPTATPIPSSGNEPVPVLAYEFNQNTLAANGWADVPGGFTGAPAGTINAQGLPSGSHPNSIDQRGLTISVNPGQVAFAFALSPINTNGNPVLLRAAVRADSADAAVALAGLKGDLAAGRADGSIGTAIPFKMDRYVNQPGYLVMMYEPDQDETVTPILQVASNAQSGSVNVWIDKLDAFVIQPNATIPGDLFQAAMDGFTVPSISKNTPDTVYEFNQGDLLVDGWQELGGGFVNAPSGFNFYWDFSFEFDNSIDQTGIVMSLLPREIMLLHTNQAVQTNNNPVLLRLNYSVDPSEGDSSVILAALQGNLNTGEFLDSSIATHQSQTSQYIMGANRWMTLVYQPSSGTIITPVVQGARLDNTEDSIFVNIDRVEMYQLESSKSYPGSLFVSGD